jgi:hypothetical protein
VRTKEVSKERIQEITLKLLDYCKKNNWAGYDPYDALNSKLLGYLPFLDFRVFRIGLTQLLKRSPVNIRPLLLIPKMQNPKALALFLMAFLKLDKLGLLEDKSLIPLMIDRLIALRSPQALISQPATPPEERRARVTAGKPQSLPARHGDGGQASKLSGSIASKLSSFPASQPPSLLASQPVSYWCWGYSFPWQTRTDLVQRWSPNLVCTIFVANALLELYETNGDRRCLDMATGAAEYILDKLYWTEGESVASFSYPLPGLRSQVHNGNFLGAALLCRVYKCSGNRSFLDPALRVARFSSEKQHDDGSWDYGEYSYQKWIDNFHTGFNLCALKGICEYADAAEFEPKVRRGFEFYERNFFTEEGTAKYFHDRTYPIDIHSIAQSTITLAMLGNSENGGGELAKAVLGWAIENMWDEKGFFYYQKYPALTIKTSYMRWSQAWMLYALATFLEARRLGG